MEIYKYNRSLTETKEWQDILNSTYSYKERNKLFDELIKKNGNEVTVQEYFSDGKRISIYSCNSKYLYICFGKPSNLFERLALSEINYDDDLSYFNLKKYHPEDLTESRTDWDDLKDYADGMYYFIEELKNEIASGNIKY